MYTIYIYWSRCGQLAPGGAVKIQILKKGEGEEEKKKDNLYKLNEAMAIAIGLTYYGRLANLKKEAYWRTLIFHYNPLNFSSETLTFWTYSAIEIHEFYQVIKIHVNRLLTE